MGAYKCDVVVVFMVLILCGCLLSQFDCITILNLCMDVQSKPRARKAQNIGVFND